MAMKWDRDDISEYIVCVQQHSCLYNVRSKEYVDRIMKAKAMNQILEHMQKRIPSVTLEDCKKKWKNLRTQFMQEERLVTRSKKSGCGMNDIYVPKLWCYDQLAFLKSHVVIRPSENNIEDSNVPSTSKGIVTETFVNEDSTTLSDSENTSPNIVTKRSFSYPESSQRKRQKKSDMFQDQIIKFTDAISQRKKTHKFHWLGLFVASELEDIHPDDQKDVALKVQNYVRELAEESARKRSMSESARKRTMSENSSSTSRDLLELSVSGIFDDSDFL